MPSPVCKLGGGIKRKPESHLSPPVLRQEKKLLEVAKLYVVCLLSNTNNIISSFKETSCSITFHISSFTTTKSHKYFVIIKYNTSLFLTSSVHSLRYPCASRLFVWGTTTRTWNSSHENLQMQVVGKVARLWICEQWSGVEWRVFVTPTHSEERGWKDWKVWIHVKVQMDIRWTTR